MRRAQQAGVEETKRGSVGVYATPLLMFADFVIRSCCDFMVQGLALGSWPGCKLLVECMLLQVPFSYRVSG